MTSDSTLLRIFETELAEGLAEIQSGLLQIERGGNDGTEPLTSILRTVHNLKGSSRVAGLEGVGHLIHAAETLLMSWRELDTIPSSEVESLFRAFDLVDSLTRNPENDSLAEQATALSTRLRQSTRVSAGKPTPALEPPTALVSESPSARGPALSSPPARVSRSTTVGTLRVPRSNIDSVRDGVTQLLTDTFVAQACLKTLSHAMRRLTSVALPHDTDHKIADARKALREAVQALRPVINKLDTESRELEDRTRALCLVPVSGLVVQLERVVRDAARQLGRDVELRVVGRDLSLDVQMVERLKEPLAHILRNAVDHGIEPEEERQRVGKPVRGHIELMLAEQGERIVVTVTDDGRGIDVEAVRARLGSAAEGLGDDELCQAILLPGLSTRDEATELSGRGIGLGAVARAVEQLRGSVIVRSTPRAGAAIVLDLPVNFSIVRGLVVRAGTLTLVLPEAMLSGVDDADPNAVPLARLLGMPSNGSHTDASKVVRLRGRQGDVAVSVDGVRSRVEVVRRSVGEHLGRVRFVEGATILEQGEPALIVDVREVVEAYQGSDGPVQPARSRGRVLLVDDSPTMRARLEIDLQATGFEVHMAEDGRAGLDRLAEASYDAVISDVQMPRLDGFGLLQSCGSDLPVILMTAYPGVEDEQRALRLGARAYLAKDENIGKAVIASLLANLPSTSEEPS